MWSFIRVSVSDYEKNTKYEPLNVLAKQTFAIRTTVSDDCDPSCKSAEETLLRI